MWKQPASRKPVTAKAIQLSSCSRKRRLRAGILLTPGRSGKGKTTRTCSPLPATDRPERDGKMPCMAINIEDLRRRARRRLPRMVFDYIDGGAADERTLHANESAYADILLRPRSGVATPAVGLNTNEMGHMHRLTLLPVSYGTGCM